jgi:hypothetical protein
MSFESAVQRADELTTLVQGAPQRSTGGGQQPATTTDGANFAQVLQGQLQQQGQPMIPGTELAQARSMGAPAYGMPAGMPATGGAWGAAPAATPMTGTVASQWGAPTPMYGTPWAPGVGGAMPMYPWQPMYGGNVGQQMVALAQQEIGVREAPAGSNDAPRIRDYRSATSGAIDTPGPWCAYFVSWLAQNAGAPIGAGGAGTGYVPTLEAWGKQSGRWIDPSQLPQPGDIVIIDWDGNGGVADHTGIVEHVAPDGTVHTIEGNTSNMVARRTYEPGSAQIKGYVRAG